MNYSNQFNSFPGGYPPNYPVYRPVVQPMNQPILIRQNPPMMVQHNQYPGPPMPSYPQPPSYPTQAYNLPPTVDPMYTLMNKTSRMKQMADQIYGRHTSMKEYYMQRPQRRELKRELSEITQLLDSVTIEVNVNKDALLNKNYQSLLLSAVQSIQKVIVMLQGANKLIAFPPKSFLGYVSSRVVRSLCLELEEKTKNCSSSFGLNLNLCSEAAIQGVSGVTVHAQKENFLEATQKEKQDYGGNFAHVLPNGFE